MRPFQSAYIGRHDFPRGLGEFELRQWLTFSIRDRRSIRKAFRSRHWIGAALHSGFIAMTGTTLRSLEYVPTVNRRRILTRFWPYRRRTRTRALLTICDANLFVTASTRGQHWTPDTRQLATPVHRKSTRASRQLQCARKEDIDFLGSAAKFECAHGHYRLTLSHHESRKVSF
jgi:hypothetical protein